MNIDPSSEEIWNELDQFDTPIWSDVTWLNRLHQAEARVKWCEEQYQTALAIGFPSSVVAYHAQELTYAKLAVDELHAERQRKETDEV